MNIKSEMIKRVKEVRKNYLSTYRVKNLFAFNNSASVLNLIKKGEIKAELINGRYRIDKQSVLDYISKNAKVISSRKELNVIKKKIRYINKIS